MMSDKKVERNIRSSESERPITPNPAASHPTGKKHGLEPESGVMGKEPGSGEDKTALLDKFREREERYRREQEDAADQGAGGADSERSGEG
jgi:hypothetical protein